MKKMLCSLILVFGFSVPASAQQTAKAEINPTQQGSPLKGSAVFEESADGLKMTVEVENAPPGLHGFHIHEFGSCEDQGKAAGSHFNPNSAPHGFLPKDGTANAHAGDFGNLEVGEDGKGHLELTLPGLSLTQGPMNVAERAIVLHAKPDSFVQPTGDSGDRIGCGKIIPGN